MKSFLFLQTFHRKVLSGEEIYRHTIHFYKHFKRGKGRVYDTQKTAERFFYISRNTYSRLTSSIAYEGSEFLWNVKMGLAQVRSRAILFCIHWVLTSGYESDGKQMLSRAWKDGPTGKDPGSCARRLNSKETNKCFFKSRKNRFDFDSEREACVLFSLDFARAK